MRQALVLVATVLIVVAVVDKAALKRLSPSSNYFLVVAAMVTLCVGLMLF